MNIDIRMDMDIGVCIHMHAQTIRSIDIVSIGVNTDIVSIDISIDISTNDKYCKYVSINDKYCKYRYTYGYGYRCMLPYAHTKTKVLAL